MNFGRNLLTLRKRAGLTLVALGELTGIQPGNIGLMEHGTLNPTREQVASIKTALHWGPETDRALAILAEQPA